MAKWRAKAIELFPDLRKEIEGESIYGAFCELLNDLSRAVRKNDIQRVSDIFGFAEWCAGQPAEDLWNAAGVSFYEHLGDDPDVCEVVHLYLKPERFFGEVEGLMKAMHRGAEAQRIRKSYRQTR